MAKRAYIGGSDDLVRRLTSGQLGECFEGNEPRTELVISEADTLLFTINMGYGARNYKKANDGDAVCAAFLREDNWLDPLLVSKTPEGAAFYIDGNYSNLFTYEGSVIYQGERWYYSAPGASYQTTTKPSSLLYLNDASGVSTYATGEDAALDLLDYYFETYKPAGDNIARKVRKAYIGIGGVARPCWNNGRLTYYGTTTGLSAARTEDLAAVANKKYALFAGGESSYQSGSVSTVDAYDAVLTRTVPTALSLARTGLQAARIGDYAVFGGGTFSGKDYTQSLAVDAYDSGLTRFNPTAGEKACDNAAATVGGYAVFAGGIGSTYQQAYADAVAYDADLVRTIPSALSQARYSGGAAAAGGYALFAGGWASGTVSAAADAYDDTLTRATAAALGTARRRVNAASNGKYVLFAGGLNGSTSYSVVDAYDHALTRTTITALSRTGQNIAGAYLEPYILFGGSDGGSNSAGVDVYDENLTRTTAPSLSAGRATKSATISDKTLFGGGRASTAGLTVVDVYTLV